MTVEPGLAYFDAYFENKMGLYILYYFLFDKKTNEWIVLFNLNRPFYTIETNFVTIGGDTRGCGGVRWWRTGL